MKKYEREIGLKTLGLTFKKRWLAMLLILVPIVGASFIVTNKMFDNKFQSTSSIERPKIFDASTHAKLAMYVKSNEVIQKTFDSLSAKTVYTATDIQNSITTPTYNSSATSYYFVITFTNKVNSNMKVVLSKLTEAVVEVALEKDPKTFEGIKINQDASTPKNIANNNKYFYIFSAIGVILAIAVPFIFEITSDEVYDKKDIKKLGSKGFELKVN